MVLSITQAMSTRLIAKISNMFSAVSWLSLGRTIEVNVCLEVRKDVAKFAKIDGYITEIEDKHTYLVISFIPDKIYKGAKFSDIARELDVMKRGTEDREDNFAPAEKSFDEEEIERTPGLYTRMDILVGSRVRIKRRRS